MIKDRPLYLLQGESAWQFSSSWEKTEPLQEAEGEL